MPKLPTQKSKPATTPVCAHQIGRPRLGFNILSGNRSNRNRPVDFEQLSTFGFAETPVSIHYPANVE
jgi:hypothetical protein